MTATLKPRLRRDAWQRNLQRPGCSVHVSSSAYEQVNQSYAPPVDQLLSLGEAGLRQRLWMNYGLLGITEDHVPELIRMACDTELNDAEHEPLLYWAPVHAWRALGRLRAAAAVDPLLELFRARREEDDWVSSDIPVVLGMIGPAALEPAAALLLAPDTPPHLATGAAHAVKEIGTRHPSVQDRVVDVLVQRLGRWSENDPDLNGFLITYLSNDFLVVEAAPLMEAAFAAERVDLWIDGDWEDAQVRLGLIPRRLAPPRMPDWFPQRRTNGQPSREEVKPRPGDGAYAAARRKAQKAARHKRR